MLGISGDGSTIATKVKGNILVLWTPDGKRIKEISLAAGLESFGISSDSSLLACSCGNALYLYNKNGERLHNFGKRLWPWSGINFDHKVFMKLVFSADNKRLIAGSQRDCTFFDIATKKVIKELRGVAQEREEHGLRFLIPNNGVIK